ncbi:CASP-like protein ARALYDRAFT_485429 [Quercus suber]|uniref:CASP-like protein ARALYDRAFT_485429 n=1 Tax=Quercus suber TaxID=58331 RepID=UPI000CE25D59|nr:CASP-like protein ARALYDRAFT_485429 isoform X1 [Quercus suber]XP_023926667.1 CASP-like protein ARALYDRAFT_485429 isoform X1 [Quercus suber]POE92829.1 casp-like protein [Quercus suber]
MDELPGAFGTSASLALRFGQTIFSLASIFFMCLDVAFFTYTSFCYLVTVMGLVIPWSITLIVVDAYSVFIKRLPRQPKILLVIIVGDLVLSYLLLAAASSTASVTTVLLAAGGCTAKPCSRYQLSAAMAFFSWFLSLASSLFNLWLLPSL